MHRNEKIRMMKSHKGAFLMAKYIFITHTHYDHLSLEDIKKIISKETIFVAPKDAQKTLEENFPNHEKFIP